MNIVKDKWQLTTVQQILHSENKEFVKKKKSLPAPPHHGAYEILVPWPWIKTKIIAVKVLNPIHWTVREFPIKKKKRKKEHFSKYLL